MKGPCKLCLKENVELHQDSHILPKFFYRMAGLFSEGGSMYYPDEHSIKTNKWRQSNSKKGEYEKYIFCKQCESILASYENYSAKLFGNQLKDVITKTILHDNSDVEYLEYGELEYAPLKLFVYSLFWRASISTRPIFSLKLDDDLEEELRSRILNAKPGPYYDLPVNFIFHLRPSFANSFHVSAPQFIKRGLYHFYHSSVFFSGLIIELVTDLSQHINILSTALREDGSIRVFMLNEEDTFVLYRNVLKLPNVSDDEMETFRIKFQNDNKSKDAYYHKKAVSIYNNPPLGYRYRKRTRK